ncbi:MAG: serine/threonine protein kinase [Gemmatimonadota bacterium]|nr:serine/threonine protein kinase [Gemmatimonadota bacterium]MDH3479989.1 serine/threonine protein kinase [Gemmatimonadota bacterium]
MTEREQLLLSRAGVGPVPSRSLPPVLLQLAVSRVRILALVLLVIELVGWLLTNWLEGDLPSEFDYVQQWGPPTFVIVVSLVMFALTRMPRVPPTRVVQAALGYEVAVSYAIVLSSYWWAFAEVPAVAVNADVVGFSGAALWMLFFTVMVPVRPTHALVALLLSATAVPIVYLLEVNGGRAPPLDAGAFFFVFVGPYLAVAGLAYISARSIYRLGQDVTRARELGSYRLVEWLGQGGMGEVWRAEHRMLARPAAVKLIHRRVLGGDSGTAHTMIARFEREAQVTATLQSPHTVEVYDYGTTDDGTFYYVMELLEGIDLQHLVQQFGPQTPARVVHILRQVCASLAEAHRRGLIHRDVKPANVYLCERAFEHDVVKVLDFGLVKWRDTRAAKQDLQLSATGTIHGTPTYMAPEIALGGGPVDGRADVYALGCVAYWLLTGQLVFDEQTYGAMLLAHVQQEPIPPSQRAEQSIPPSLDAIVLDCLQKSPSDRMQSAEALAARLDAVELVEPWTADRARRWWEAHGGEIVAVRAPSPEDAPRIVRA